MITTYTAGRRWNIGNSMKFKDKIKFYTKMFTKYITTTCHICGGSLVKTEKTPFCSSCYNGLGGGC